MNSEEQVFDFLAAAEDTGKQLDNLLKAIPGEVRETLAAEYQKSPWLATLPATADKVTAAAERAEEAAEVFIKKAINAGIVVFFASVSLPVLVWGYSYWQTSDLRAEQARLITENRELENAGNLLKGGTAGGARIHRNDDGSFDFILPPGQTFPKLIAGSDRITYRPVAQ